MEYKGNLVLPAAFAGITQDEMQYYTGGGTASVVLTTATQQKLISAGITVVAALVKAKVGSVVWTVISGTVNSLLSKLYGTVKGDITLISVGGILIPNATFRI